VYTETGVITACTVVYNSQFIKSVTKNVANKKAKSAGHVNANYKI